MVGKKLMMYRQRRAIGEMVGMSLLIVCVLMIKRAFLPPCVEQQIAVVYVSFLREAAWSLRIVSACYYVHQHRHAS